MLTVVIVMALGIVAGYFLRVKPKITALADRLTMWAIYLLLFLLGVAIGTNDVIVKNLPMLGLRALYIAIGGITGSVLLAWLVYHFWFKQNNSENEG